MWKLNELDWYNYAAKVELKTAGADTSDFAKMILILINWKMYQVMEAILK